MRILLLFITVFICQISFSQNTDEQISKQQRRLYYAHQDIFKLPYNQEYIQSTILQEVYQKREELCPNYPDRNQLHENKTNSLKNWMIDHPDEYNSYIKYLETFIRSHASKKD